MDTSPLTQQTGSAACASQMQNALGLVTYREGQLCGLSMAFGTLPRSLFRCTGELRLWGQWRVAGVHAAVTRSLSPAVHCSADVTTWVSMFKLALLLQRACSPHHSAIPSHLVTVRGLDMEHCLHIAMLDSRALSHFWCLMRHAHPPPCPATPSCAVQVLESFRMCGRESAVECDQPVSQRIQDSTVLRTLPGQLVW